MGTFIYTAKRSTLAHHIVDESYQLDIGVTSSTLSRRPERSVVRAKGGTTETLYHRADKEWSISFEPVNGHRLNELLEFLDSTESGESFQMQIYGTESSFTTVERSDDGYSLTDFMRVGSEDGDWFTASITVRAV